MRVAIYDDYKYIAKALTDSFHQIDETIKIASFNDSKELLSYLEKYKSDIIILELLTAEDLGLQLINKSTKLYPQPFIVVYSMVSMPFIRDCVVEAGANIFINKRYSPEQAAKMILDKKTLRAR